jgi:hypothetical protein
VSKGAQGDAHEPLNGNDKLHRLRQYNNFRQTKLVSLPEVQKPAPVVKENDKVTDAMKMKTHCFTNNLTISLFWEEIFQIMVRVMQLYSFFFLIFYEYWPSFTRMYLTPLFSSFMLSFHVLN